MEENKPTNNEIQIELSDEVAQGTYANLAIISHSASEFILDFIRVVPGAPKAKVQSRIILTPDNAQRLLFALQDNLSIIHPSVPNIFSKIDDSKLLCQPSSYQPYDNPPYSNHQRQPNPTGHSHPSYHRLSML